jgi:hypothetical protein
MPIPWREIFRRLIQAGARPESVGKLSPAQLQIILLRTADARRIVRLTSCEAMEFRAQRARERDCWVEEQSAALRRDEERPSLSPRHAGLEVLASLANSLINRRARVARRAARPRDTVVKQKMLNPAIRELLKRIEALLDHRAASLYSGRSDGASRFSDGP